VRPDLGADELVLASEEPGRRAAARISATRRADAETDGLAAPVILGIAIEEGQLTIEWTGRAGAVYEVEGCSILGQWERVGPLVTLGSEVRTRWADPRWLDLDAPPVGFYRVRELRTETAPPHGR